jgi:hypothetical protein
MSSQNLTVLCGGCKCAVETVANPQAHDKVTCPRCHRSDRFDKVMDSVKEHVLHLTTKAMSESLARSTRGNRYVKFETKQPSHRSFRWISDYRA